MKIRIISLLSTVSVATSVYGMHPLKLKVEQTENHLVCKVGNGYATHNILVSIMAHADALWGKQDELSYLFGASYYAQREQSLQQITKAYQANVRNADARDTNKSLHCVVRLKAGSVNS